VRSGLLAGLAALLVLVGCASDGGGRAAKPAQATPTPTYDELAARYNERLEGMDRLFAEAVFRVWYVDEEGQDRSNQLRGWIQYVRPDSFLVSFTKLGETHLLVGSNAERYWWIELGEEKRAWVGRHEDGPVRVTETDLPVHPADLLEVLGLRPLPGDAPGAQVVRTEGSDLRVTLPGRSGLRVVEFDPRTYRTRRVRIVDEAARVLVEADLTRYKRVERRPDRNGPRPRIAHTVEMRAGEDLGLRVHVYSPVIRPDKPKEKAFDLDALLAAYRVEDVTEVGEGRLGLGE